MALNVPSGNTADLSFGPGILYITDNVLATPNVDIGYVQGAQFSYNRNKLDVQQGSPKVLVQTFALGEEVTLSVTGIQWSLNNLKYVFGNGTISGNVMSFGGDAAFDEVALLFRHKTPKQGTVEIRLWKAQGQGQIQLNFNDNLQEFPFGFRALNATQQWGGGTLADDAQIGQLYYVRGS